MHELLGSRTRHGEFGGSLENRTRLIRSVIEQIRTEVPSLAIGVRFSACLIRLLMCGASRARDKLGLISTKIQRRRKRFLLEQAWLSPDELLLDEAFALLDMLSQAGVSMINISAGSPYYNRICSDLLRFRRPTVTCRPRIR